MASDLTIELVEPGVTIGDRLVRDLEDATDASIAVAFAKQSALRKLPLEPWCRDGGRLNLVAGTDFALTELELLRRVEALPNTACRVYHSVGATAFHPKLYVLDKKSSSVAYLGSSNLTLGGLTTNLEANIRLEGPADAPEMVAARRLFKTFYGSEFTTPITAEFEQRYQELQVERRRALSGVPSSAESRLHAIQRLLLAEHRARTATQRRLLVVSPENYALCMQHRTWGHQHESDIRAYNPGDIFFFHVTGGRGVAAMGMFTGMPYFDSAPLWQAMKGGSFPWRIRFVPLGELRTGIPTKAVLEPLRDRPAKNWFQGFIQASHGLSVEDFEALRLVFEKALRQEQLEARAS